MNFKSLIVVGLGIATLGLSLPAHADTATSVIKSQDAFITGHGNTTVQNSETKISNRERGKRNSSSTGTVVQGKQAVDVAGDDNLTVQNEVTNIDNDRDSRKSHRRHH